MGRVWIAVKAIRSARWLARQCKGNLVTVIGGSDLPAHVTLLFNFLCEHSEKKHQLSQKNYHLFPLLFSESRINNNFLILSLLFSWLPGSGLLGSWALLERHVPVFPGLGWRGLRRDGAVHVAEDLRRPWRMGSGAECVSLQPWLARTEMWKRSVF